MEFLTPIHAGNDDGVDKNAQLHRKSVASSFWNHELEEELYEQGWEDFKFHAVDDREKVMEIVDAKRAVTVYEHKNCPEECRRRGEYYTQPHSQSIKEPLIIGCGALFAMDGNWKLCYPICMFKVKKEISGFDGALQYVDSCPNSPVTAMAFCTEHCQKAQDLGIPCKLKDFLCYSKVRHGMA